MRLFGILLLSIFISCASTSPINPTPTPVPPVPVPVDPIKYDTIHKTVYDTLLIHRYTIDTLPQSTLVNVLSFGAAGNGSHDDYQAIQTAVDYLITHPGMGSNLYFPPGNYVISHPIILQSVANGRWQFFTIHLVGDAPAKSAPDAYMSKITCAFNNGFAIGVQFGRGIKIENLCIIGRYTFPQRINNYNIGTTLYSTWNDGSVEDKRYAPYSGICIDPFCDSSALTDAQGYTGMRQYYLPNTGRGGTSGMEIRQCGIHNFAVGIMLTPNPLTQNDEMINIIDDCIDNVKVAIALGQDQSKEIHIDRFKCWASTYTLVDGMNYGAGSAPCSVMINGMNIAGNVNQLFNLNAGRFPLSAKDIYSESVFRIGYVNGSAGVNFDNFQIDLLTGAGMPAADYIFSGGPITWRGGMLRYYDGQSVHRMNLSQMYGKFADVTLSNPPMTVGLYALGINGHPTPTFDNVWLYYGNGLMPNKGYEELYQFPYNIPVTVDRINWLATLTVPSSVLPYLQVGDYVMAEPVPTNGHYYDQGMNPHQASTIQIGRVEIINGNKVVLDDVGLNATTCTSCYGNFYIDAIPGQARDSAFKVY